MRSQLTAMARRSVDLSYSVTASLYDYALSWQRRVSSSIGSYHPATRTGLHRYSDARDTSLRARDEERGEQLEQDLRRPLPEQDPWDRLFSLQLTDLSARAWEATLDARQALCLAGVTLSAGFECTWYRVPLPVLWTPREVAEVGRAVRNIAQVFGQDARHIVSGARIVRRRNARYPFLLAGRRAPAFQQLLTTHVNDHAFRSPGTGEHTLTHELGHYLQESQHLLGKFKRARSSVYPNDYARTRGPAEDFAASFEVFVYESLGAPVIENGQALALDKSRRDFFLQFVKEQQAWNRGPA